MKVSLAVLVVLAGLAHAQLDGPTVTLPELGTLVGREVSTVGNLGNPTRNYFHFQNIPFAESVSGDRRFSQPVQLRTSLGTEASPYDATKSGPLCPQMGLSQAVFDNMNSVLIEDAVANILASTGLEGVITVELVMELLEGLFEKELSGLTIMQVVEVLADIQLSVDEDCLHLTVSTPQLPAVKEQKQADLLPVMVFVYGGGFSAGTQLKMGYDRIGDVADVVVVAISYRLGPLGFMCLDTDSAAGNMGLLDQIVALEWVRDNIAYFGGDPNKVTIFGESAGSASVSLLALSPEAEGLFTAVIGQSASAVSPWAFDDVYPEFHARRFAAKVGCSQTDLDAMVDCLKTVDHTTFTSAYSEYQSEELARGTLGFGGTIPCGQTQGARKVFEYGQRPREILARGEYTHLPMFYGANKDEGLLGYGMAYTGFLNESMMANEQFLTHDIVDMLLAVVGMSQEYVFSQLIRDTYFRPEELGNFDAMFTGFVDLMGVLSIKASAYKMVEDNSNRADSYFYALEQKSRKSFHRIFYGMSNPDMPMPDPNVMAAHADDLLYLFHVPLPLVFCDVGEFFTALSAAYVRCSLTNPDDAVGCVTDPEGNFKQEWMECIDGRLLPDEQVVSDAMVKAWSNFAIYGTPTPSGSGLPTLAPWTKDQPNYLVFSTPVAVATDYTQSYVSERPAVRWPKTNKNSKPRKNVH